jgi:hypothetical protein
VNALDVRRNSLGSDREAHFRKILRAIKRSECDEYRMAVSQWRYWTNTSTVIDSG